MLRMNLMADEATRKDLMTLVRGMLREAVPAALAEVMKDDGWLDKRFDAAFERLNLVERALRRLSASDFWRCDAPSTLIDDRIKRSIGDKLDLFRREAVQIAESKYSTTDAKINEAIGAMNARTNKLIEYLQASIRQMPEDKIRQIVAEELRKILLPKV